MAGPHIRLLAALLLALIGLWPAAAAAQGSDRTVPVSGGTLSVELSQGRLVRLQQPATSVFIANPAIADVSVKSSRMVYVFGKAPGQTTLFAVDRNENVVADLQIIVQHNVERLDATLQRLLPAAAISVNSIAGGIVLSGSVATATEAENAVRIATRFLGDGEEIINQLEITEPNQVNLRVRIAEVSREILNRFGFNWDALVTSGNFFFDLAILNPTLESTSFLTGNFSNGSVDINGVIDALADDGLLTVLAEPNLTALSGETASFLAGGEFPIPVSQDEDTITIEFKEFGVSLAFTPTLIGSSRISMRVRPEVSQLSTAGAVALASIQIPSLTTRRAETTVELASGQSFAIAGLLLDNSQELIKKTPGLGDLPVLGALFKSERFERNETELVIIVTPYIVQPVSTDRLPLPTDPYILPRSSAGMKPGPVAAQTIPLPGAAASAAAPARAAGYLLD